MNKIALALDIGTTKIGVVFFEIQEDDNYKILGIGATPSDGVKSGSINNIDRVVRSIKKAVDEVTQTANITDYHQVYVNISGKGIRSLNSKGLATINGTHTEITESDVNKVLEAARTIHLPVNSKILHVIPQYFTIDDQVGIKDPIGMSGIRLETMAHIITAEKMSIQNIYNSFKKNHLNINGIFFNSLAAAESVLQEDEKQLGVALIDIGGGTTDLVVFVENSIRHSISIPIGGDHITNDIAVGVATPFEQAEKIKIQYGVCWDNENSEEVFIPIPGLGGRPEREVVQSVLIDIIEPRLREVFILVAKELERFKLLNSLGAGLVFTGGSSLMPGIIELSKDFFEKPIRLGYPEAVQSLEASTPAIYSVSAGLVYHGIEQNKIDKKREVVSNIKKPSRVSGFFDWVKQYL